MMASKAEEEKVTQLIQEALTLTEQGKEDDGSRALREAAKISPQNQAIQATFLQIQQHESQNENLKLINRFVQLGDDRAGNSALADLKRPITQLPDDAAVVCIRLLDPDALHRDVGRQLTVLLLKKFDAVQKFYIRIFDTPSGGLETVFNRFWSIGADLIDAFFTLLLNEKPWPSSKLLEKCRADSLQLLLAKLKLQDENEKERAIKCIAQLLNSDAKELCKVVNFNDFAVLLEQLHADNSKTLRTSSMVSVVKLFEAANARYSLILEKHIVTKVKKGTIKDLVLAFYIAAALFPIVPSIAAKLFLSEEFLPSLMKQLDKPSKDVKLETAAFDMLSAACIDDGCRKAILSHCNEVVQRALKSDNEAVRGFAALIVTKTNGMSQTGGATATTPFLPSSEINLLTSKFRKLLDSQDELARDQGMEGIAFATLQPNMKQQLADDPEFLKTLLSALEQRITTKDDSFGPLTVLQNLTRLPPKISEEDRKMMQLRAYANNSQLPPELDTLDEEPAVKARCEKILAAGFVPALVRVIQNLRPITLLMDIQIMLSIAMIQSARAQMASNGVIKAMLKVIESMDKGHASQQVAEIKKSAAALIARVLVSVDPNLVFNDGTMPVATAVKPLFSLLPGTGREGPHDLFATFETLHALTNLATIGEGIRSTLVYHNFSIIEDLLYSSNTNIQRAAMELICNLLESPVCLTMYCDPQQGVQRIRTVLALTNVDDPKTRLAAGGAIAKMAPYEQLMSILMELGDGCQQILRMCAPDESRGMHERAVVCICEMINLVDEDGRRARSLFWYSGACGVLQRIVRADQDAKWIWMAKEALEIMLKVRP